VSVALGTKQMAARAQCSSSIGNPGKSARIGDRIGKLRCSPELRRYRIRTKPRAQRTLRVPYSPTRWAQNERLPRLSFL